MDNDTKEKNAQINESTIRVLSVSSEEFSKYLSQFEQKFGDLVCPLCRGTMWGVPPRFDSAKHPALVTMPLPNSSGLGVWAFPINCMACGYIATFSAHVVAKNIKGE